MPEVLKVCEVAELLRVSKATVQRWCANGQLPAFKIGQHWRIDAALLKEMIEEATGPLPDSDVLNDVL